jgi:hypothetical protein
MRLAAPLLAGLLAVAPIPAFAWPSPQQAVERFLDFELAGGRLQAWDFHRYLAVGPDYDEPGWDQVHVVERHRVSAVRCETTARCVADVEFTYAGGASPTRIAHPAGTTEVVRYVAVHAGGEWLLASTDGAPRVDGNAFRRLVPSTE